MICQEKGLKQYILKEYGSWGVMTLSYLTGLIVSGRATPGAVVVFIAIALYINSKQAFVLWMRRRGENPVRSLAVFLMQGLVATSMLLPFLWSSLVSLMPYVLVPFVYLLCLKFLGEHSLFTEISGFVLLSLAALVAKLTTTGVIDPALFTTVAIYFTAGVFKVRVQFTKGMPQRVLMVFYIGFALAVYRLIHTPVLVLLPLFDNLVFSVTLYRAKLSVTGWLEVLKGVAFLLLMAFSYR
jgi:YwiC-like protein